MYNVQGKGNAPTPPMHAGPPGDLLPHLATATYTQALVLDEQLEILN
jgi:hypothetical protein